MWTLGLSVGTDRVSAAVWNGPGVDELRLEGPVPTPPELAGLTPGAPAHAAERALAAVVGRFVAAGRVRNGNVPPSAVTVVLAWDPGSAPCAAADRVLGMTLPGALRRVIGAPVGAPGSPGAGYDPEPARVVAKLGADAVSAGRGQPLPPPPPVNRRRVPVLVVVLVALLAAAVAGGAAYVPLQARYNAEHDRRTSAVEAQQKAEQHSKDTQEKLTELGGYSVETAGAASFVGSYPLALRNTACVAFLSSSCRDLDLDIQFKECYGGGYCISGTSTKQDFSRVKVERTTNGYSVSGEATGYTCDDKAITDANWRLDLWPSSASYDAAKGTWQVTSVGASFVIHTGGGCDEGLIAWSGSNDPGEWSGATDTTQ